MDYNQCSFKAKLFCRIVFPPLNRYIRKRLKPKLNLYSLGLITFLGRKFEQKRIIIGVIK